MANDKPDTTHNASSGAFWAYVQNWAGRGLTLLVFFFLARLLSPTDFGAFALVTVILTLAEVFVEQGFAHAIIQREHITNRHLSSAFWATLILGAILSIIVLSSATWFANSAGDPRIAVLVRALSPIFLLMALASVPAALLRRELNYKALAKRTTLANLLSGVSCIAAAAGGLGVWSFIVQLLVFHTVGLVTLWRAEPWRPTREVDYSCLKELAVYSYQIIAVKLLDFVETRVLDIIVGKVSGLHGLGNFSLATRANQALTQMIAAPMWEAAISGLSRVQSDRVKFGELMHNMLHLLSLIAFPAFIFVATMADTIVKIVFGAQWTNAGSILLILCIVGVVRIPLFMCGAAIQALGHASLSWKVALLRTVSLLLWAYILPIAGTERFAWAILLSLLTAGPVTSYFYLTETQTSIKHLATPLARPLLSSLLASALVLLVNHQFELTGLKSLISSGIVFASTYLLICGKDMFTSFKQRRNKANA